MRSATWNMCPYDASHFCWSLKMLNETSIILRSLTSEIPRTKVRKQDLNMPEASSHHQVGRDFVKSFRGAFAKSKFRNLQLSDSVTTPLGQLSDVIDRLVIVAAGEWFHTNGKWSHNSKPPGYLAAGEWFHTNGKWSHKQATRQKRWVGWILNEIFMVINSFHWYFAES